MSTLSKSRGEYRPFFEAMFHGKDYRRLSPEAKLFLVTLKGLCGAPGIRTWAALAATLAEMTGVPEIKAKKAVKELVSARWIEYEDGIVWVVRGLEFEPSISADNPKHRTWLDRELETLPRVHIVERFRIAYAAWFTPADAQNAKGIGIGYPKGYAVPSPIPSAEGIDTVCQSSPQSTVHSPPPLPQSTSKQPVAAGGEPGAIVDEANGDHRLQLTAAANQGITEQFGEQTRPLNWAAKGAHQLAEALQAAAVPLDFALPCLRHLAASRTPQDGKPPRSLSYFADAVVDAWQSGMARDHAAALQVGAMPSAPGELTYDQLIADQERELADLREQREARELAEVTHGA